MDQQKPDYLFWRIVHHFVSLQSWRLVYQQGKEVWVENDAVKPIQLIRIVREDYDWGNRLKEDHFETAKKMELIRRQRGYKELKAENIYISHLPPVDDWSIIQKPIYVGKKKKTLLQASLIYMHEENNQYVIDNERPHSFLKEINDELLTHTATEPYQLEEKILVLKHSIKKNVEKKANEEKGVFTYGKPIFTFLFIILNALIFLLVEWQGDSQSVLTLIEFGAKYNPLILEGEWWRLLSSMFLHIGFLHVLMNSIALYFLGTLVERMFGSARFLIIYFISGFFGTLASLWMNISIGAGASGAIFGLFGAILYFGLIHKRLFIRTMGKNVLFILIINLAIGFFIPVVDMSAHVGGLIAGFFAAMLVQLPHQKKSRVQLYSLMLLVLVLLSSYLMKDLLMQKEEHDYLEVQVAQEYINDEQYEQAELVLKRVLEKDTSVAEAYFLYGYLLATKEDYLMAKQMFEQAVQLNPELHSAYYNLSLIAEELNDMDEAIEMIQQALMIEPNNEQYQERQEQLNESR
ncbi:hypothetical protein BTS2_3158 [Bacillus sp. TS-2]|nr:hypothetical protein BTS2_3158 [Bacillus sp. TS-2]